jgi:hypothetical protein
MTEFRIGASAFTAAGWGQAFCVVGMKATSEPISHLLVAIPTMPGVPSDLAP